MVTKDGISVDLRKVDVVSNWRRPNTVTEIQSFLGLTGYYTRFIEGFSKISLPLTRLTQKGVKFQWSDDTYSLFIRIHYSYVFTIHTYSLFILYYALCTIHYALYTMHYYALCTMHYYALLYTTMHYALCTYTYSYVFTILYVFIRMYYFTWKSDEIP